MNKLYLKSITSLDKTLKESELGSIGADIAEVSVDSLIDDGLLKDIPIVSTIVGLIKTTSSINSALLLKKIVYFLDGVKDVSPKKRYEMIAEINNSPKYKISVGEKLLYIIERCEDHEKASLVAEWFKAFLNKEIDYDDFLHGSSVLNALYADDLDYFLKVDEKKFYVSDAMQFVSLGLCVIELGEPKLVHHEDGDWDDPPAHYTLEETEHMCLFTDLGHKLRKVFKER